MCDSKSLENFKPLFLSVFNIEVATKDVFGFLVSYSCEICYGDT